MVFSHIPMAHAAAESNSLLLAELQARFPGVRLVEVTQTEFEILLASNSDHAVILVEAPTEESPQNKESRDARAKDSTLKEHRPPPPLGTVVPARASIGSRVNITAYGSGTGSVATDDLAVILYVLIGAVVVAAAVLYGGFILYEIMAGTTEYPYWRSCAASAWHFTGSGRKGGMYGGRVSLGLLDERTRVGLLLEAGYLDGRFRFRDDDRFLTVHGAYGLLGPTVHWALREGDNPMVSAPK